MRLKKPSGAQVKDVIDVSARVIALILSAAVLAVSHRGDVIDTYSASDTDGMTEAPSKDELMSGADEVIPEYRDLMMNNEYPLGLGIYDKLFTSDTPPAPDGQLQIVPTDLSKNALPEQVQIKNNTHYSLSASSLLTVLGKELDGSRTYDPSQPLVLIYHTHGTEGYAEEGKTSYSPSALPRSRDVSKNVVAVGAALSKILNENGIPTLHCPVMHDDGSYNTAYSNSARSVKEYLKKYPSIKYAFDVHRDALVSATSVYKTVTYDESTPVAQLMFVVGTNEAGADHDSWRRCLSFAVNVQYLLACRLNNLVRPISVKQSSYNQQYPYVGALIEVGTCANTLKEALSSAEILGRVLSVALKSDLALSE